MQNSTDSAPAAPALRRALGAFDLVLLNVAVITGLRWLSTAAQAGPSGLSLWLLACLVFFIPSGLAVQELSSRIPHEGGLYLWIRAAFGDTNGFIAAWAYSLSNLVFFPSLLLFITGILLHIGAGSWLSLAESPTYNGLVALSLLWAATLLNILGLERAKWLQNVGGCATVIVAALVLFCGAVAVWRFGSATPITSRSLVPDLSSPPTLNTLAILILGFSGLELAPILGDEIRDSARTVRRAIVISGAIITVIYVAGTAALLVGLPARLIGVISGIPEALEAIGLRAGVPHLGTIAAGLLAVSAIGGLGGWVSGTARLPFMMGLSRYLPARLGALHPKYGTPYVALLVQAVAVSLVILGAIFGSAIHEAYLLLIDMTTALNCLAWMYIFASLAVLRRRAGGRNEGVAVIPGGAALCWLLAGTGVAATGFATVASLIPPSGSGSPTLFLLKGVGGCALIVVTGYLICRRGTRGVASAGGH